MKINIVNNLDIKSDVLILGVFDTDKTLYEEYNKELAIELKDAIARKTFDFDFGKSFVTKITNSAYKRIIVFGLGKKEEMTANRVRQLMARSNIAVKSSRYSSFTTNIIQKISASKILEPKVLGMATSEGLILSDYKFDKYLTKKDPKIDVSALIVYDGKSVSEKSDDFKTGISTGSVIANSTNYSKDLINEPAMVVTPTYLEGEAKKLAKNPKIKLTVLNKSDMEKKGLGCILAVSAGSNQDPKLLIIEYTNGPKNSEKIAIVGKGITFDCGGYDIKPAGQFTDMKCDMSGASAVLGTLKVATELNLQVNLIGVIPTCENLVNGSAYKPGDILTAYNGKTIEITNTDAEGRLVLADAVSYVDKNYSPDKIIDLATLTGACVVALGYYASGLISNNQDLEKDLIDAGFRSYDRVWPLPFFEEYQDNMDGDISDLKNTSVKGKGREAGAITGAVFISKFVDKAKWAHLDIAGRAFLAEAKDYDQKYASGAGVRLLSYYLMK